MSAIRVHFIEHRMLDFFKNNNIIVSQYPIDVIRYFSFIPNCKILTYSEFSNKYCSNTNMSNMCLSNDGCTFYDSIKKKYLTLYNSNILPERIRYTLAHELGHIILGHLEYLSTHNISQTIELFETEANYFASTILAPLPIFKKHHIQSAYDVHNMYGLSIQASQITWEHYLLWSSNHFKTAFDSEINQIYL